MPAAQGFERVAPIYGAMEALLAGGVLLRARTALSDSWPQEGHALLVGEGVGHFLHALRRDRPQLRITCLDASPRMLETARRRLRRRGLPLENIIFTHADVLTWTPPDRYDMIATHFFLDCFEAADLRALVAKLADAARPDARWFLADFQIPARGLRRLRARAILGLLYAFFRLTAGVSARHLESPIPLLREHGFQVQATRELSLGLISSSLLTREAAAV